MSSPPYISDTMLGNTRDPHGQDGGHGGLQDHDIPRVDEAQFANLEIDTPATDRFDDGKYPTISPHKGRISPAARTFSLPALNDDESEPLFSFGKAQIKTPAMSRFKGGAPAPASSTAPTSSGWNAGTGIGQYITLLMHAFC